MKSTNTLIRKTIPALLVGALIGFAHIGAVQSRDTDIYFNSSSTKATKANVLVIIDTSGSMVSNLVPDGSGGQITRLQAMKNAFNTILDDPSTQNIKMGLMRFSGARGGPVLFPVADLDAKAVDIVGNTPVTVEALPATSSDDAEQVLSTGAVSLTSSTLDLINNGTADQIVGMRFQNVVVPSGATITAAYILFQPNANDSGATSLTVKAQNSGNPATFTASTNDVSTRTNAANAVGTAVSWSTVPAWTSGGDRVATPDISSLIQPIVNRSDWCGGNSMVLTVEGSGRRRATSFDSSPTGAPILVVQYDPTTVPTGACNTHSLQVQIAGRSDDAEERVSNGNMTLNGSPINVIRNGSNDQLVGLRFQNIGIPAGATIQSAFIDFTISAANTSTPSYTIVGQKALTPGTFTNGGHNISNRISGTNKTSASVAWTSVPNPAAGSTLTTPDLKSVVQEVVNQTGWASGNPMVFVTTGSGTRQVVSFDGNSRQAAILRIKYQANDTASVSSDTVRERLKQVVNGMNAAGNTPIVDTLYEAGLYYRGQPVLYGLQRGDQSGTDAQFTRVSHPATYTGASGVFRDPSCIDANLDAAACVTEEILGTPSYVSPFDDGCQKSYIILLTDGAPTVNNSQSLVESLIGTSCATSIAGSVGNCSNELVQYYLQNNLSSFTDIHNIVTHTIGFGSDVTNATDVQYLQDLATAGGGTFTTAGDATSLVTAIQNILNRVNSDPTSFVSPSLSVNAFNKLFNRDEVYFSLFSPQKEVRWPGNIKKFTLCNDATNATCNFGEVLDANSAPAIGTDAKIKKTAQSIWSSVVDGPTVTLGGAGERIPPRASRKVYTYTGTADVPASPVDLSSTPVNTTNVTKAMLGDSTMTDARQSDIVNWMLGQDIKDENGNSSTTDDRWKFADALHSRPLTISYGGTDVNPVIKMFVGTDDGALRMINTNDGTNRGQEEWAVYLPEFLPVQGQLMDDPQGVHMGGVSGFPSVGLDGTPTAYIIDNNTNGIIEPGSPNNDKVLLFIGERRGGRNMYAFDVTPDATLSDPTQVGQIKPKLLWRISGGTGSFAALGQTWSRPAVTKIRVKCHSTSCDDGTPAPDSDVKTVLIFAGGYDPNIDNPGSGNVVPTGGDSEGNAIYIVDPSNGSLIWWAGGPGSGANLELANMKYAIPSDLALLDTDGDGATDRIYVGDSRGQVWRLDLGNQIDPGQPGTGGSSGYVFADIGCTGGTRTNDCSATSRQQHRMFFYPPSVAPVEDDTYSTNPNYDIVAIASGNREDPLDKLTLAVSSTEQPVHNRMYAFRDYDYKTGAPATARSPLTETDLYDATNNNLGTYSGSALQTEITTNVADSKGWMIKLKESASPNWIGEKGLAKPVIFGGQLFYTTFVPTSATSASASCTLSEGTGRLYAVNYINATPIYDFNGDGTVERQYSVGGGIPSEAVVVIREGGVTALVGTSGGAAQPGVNLKLPRYTTYWYEE